jgi:hypothetical protein
MEGILLRLMSNWPCCVGVVILVLFAMVELSVL